MSKPTGRARELGASLRHHRERAEWSEKQAADFLEISQGQLCRIELGYRSVSETNVIRALAMYGVCGEDFAETLALAREIKNDYRVLAHKERLPDELRTLIHFESTATHVDSYQPALIPGLLQTEDYARAVFRWCALFPEDGIETRVRARLDRQKQFDRPDRASYRFFVHEDALAPAVFDAKIMSDQLLSLLFACHRPRCEIRIVPAAAGPVLALVNGSFLFMRFGEHSPAVYIENLCTSEFLEAPAVLEKYSAIVNRLADVALSEAESRERIASLAT